MQLLSLTIDGFKSFANKTTIKFEEGMTGIVGPNGSGKSNIIEAIRWVMGEQSARHLRGDKMVDVIFNGAANRAPLNRALVSITFDNSDHYLASDFNELTITRKLFRNGDSEYLLNGNKVRLKDIVDLFIDSGLGRESFSIISQGRIEAIFNGKPEDRRAIIETVAGVAKYRKNKQTAERRLGQTMDNLNRVNDIVSELASQLEPLADQSALAKDYLEQKEQFDRLDQTQLVRNYDQQHDQLQRLQSKLADSRQLVDQYRKKTAAADTELEKYKQQRTALQRDKDAANQSILRQTQLIADYQNQQSISTVKRQQQEQEQHRLSEQISANQQEQEQVQKQLAAVKQNLTVHEQTMADHKKQLQAAEQQTASERLQQLQARLEELRNQQIELLQQQTTLHNQANYLQENHRQALNVQKESDAELAALKEQQTAQQRELTAKQQEVAQQRDRLAATNHELSGVQEQLEQLTNRYQEQQRKWYQLLGDAHSTAARIKDFRAREDDYDGYYHGVQSVLRNRQQFAGLAGAVGELITTPANVTTAIETVLGGQLQQLVVDRQDTGKEIIRFLTRQRAGRVTILPLDTLRPRRPLSIWLTLEGMPGYVGRATDLVQYDQRYQLIIDYLLGSTVVVDNLDNATAIARAGYHQVRVVTLDGQLINASGAMTGGANRHQRAGVLTQKQTGQQLANLLADQQQNAKQAEATVAKLQASQQQGQAKLADLQAAAQEQADELRTAETALNLLADQAKTTSQRVATLQYQTDEQTSRHSSYQDQLQTNSAAQQQIDAQLATVKKQTEEVNQQITELRHNADAQNDQVHELQQWLAVAKERQQQYQRQAAALDQQLAQLKSADADLGQQLHQLEERYWQQGTHGEDTATALSTAQEALAGYRQQLAAADDQLTALADQLNAAESNQERLMSLERAALDNLNTLNEQRIRCEGQLDQLQNQLRDHHSLTIAAARQKADQQISDADLARQLKLLQRGLNELGTINVSAIEEYDRVKERYDFLKGQQQDLLESRTQLQQTMDEMDGEVKQRFMATFKEVSAAFNETFRQIFAGGRAKLELTDPHDLLTTGVDIMAQPPGKKNRYLNLLSGGERALTAITLLFAILKVRPVPFAILDEPEAALDEVNVQRFANYLQRFGKEGPQFIVITHRKGTMMGVDVLYGVTMQESGVSKMVSVDVIDTLNDQEE